MNNKHDKHDKHYLSAPNIVYIDITNKCNLNCKHCYVQAGLHNDIEIELKVLEKLFIDIKKMGSFGIVISGGEPLVRDDIFDIIDMANKNKLLIGLSTNGTLVDNNFIERTKGKISNVQVSLDSSNYETHEKFRGKKDIYMNTLENIKVLSDNGFYVTIATVLTEDNYCELEELIKIAIRVGAKKYRVLKLINVGNAAINEINKVSKIQLKEFKSTISQLKNKYNQYIEIELDSEFSDSEYCTAAFSALAINCKGDVYPCPFLNNIELLCGNINTNNISYIWNNSKVLNRIRKISKPESCIKCYMENNCGGGCKAAIYAKYKEFKGKSPNCLMD